MAISDLTNTTWTINETPNFSPLQYLNEEGGQYEFAINYTVDIDGTIVDNYSLIISEIVDFLSTDMYIYYTEGPAYTCGSWSNELPRTIEITGGTDATNSDLIAWLEANATQIVEPGITDLTGTKWYFNEVLQECDPDTWMSWNLIFTSDSQEYNNLVRSYGYLFYSVDGGISTSVYYDEGGASYWYSDGVYRTIEITGGTDATNSTLISWILANATQVEPEVVTPVPSSFATLRYDSSTKTLVINGINYVLDSSASGNSVIGTSFSNIALTEEGVLTIDGVSINLPLYSVTPENSILMSDGTYLVDVNEDYITTTEV